MPVTRCGDGKYKIDSGKARYRTKEKAEKAYAAYNAKKHGGSLFLAMEAKK